MLIKSSNYKEKPIIGPKTYSLYIIFTKIIRYFQEDIINLQDYRAYNLEGISQNRYSFLDYALLLNGSL
jgi:hypothetical protein